jgi:hypothetical protein
MTRVRVSRAKVTDISLHRKRVIETLTREYLCQKYLIDKMTVKEIAKENNFPYWTVRNRLTSLKISCGRKRYKEIIGKEFGLLKVIRKADAISKQVIWMCKCKCGNVLNVAGGNLRSGGSTSCGCTRYKKGFKNARWKGQGELSGRYWRIMQSNAIKRGIEFNIDIEYGWNLFLSQNSKCALSGIEICFSQGNTQTASLDRIDSNLGYNKENAQWVHKTVNLMKNILSQEEFVNWCHLISEKAKSKDGTVKG